MKTIIIAEKPDAAERIASALSSGRMLQRKSRYGVKYWEFVKGNRKHIVVAAVGHLFSLKQKTKGWSYPIFSKDIEWKPSYKVAKGAAFSERYYKTIESVADEDAEYIVACDYDNEGSLIGYNILRFIFNRDQAKRMFFSTLTKDDLVSSYENVKSKLDWENIKSGETRHYLDWLYGINTSRALTLAIKKNSKRFTLITAGRVQGPTLSMLAEREKEIMDFKPEPYWQLRLVLLALGNEIEAMHEKDKIWDEKEADKIYKECEAKKAVVEDFTKKKYRQNPPDPFNITSLQTEAYRAFGYSPQQTLKIAQALYTNAYISYPRTSSEKLPPQIDYKKILKALSSIAKYKAFCRELLEIPRLKPKEGKRTDAAHEAIHPTFEPPKKSLGMHEQRIYDMVCRRFFAVFAQSAIREAVNVVIDVNGHKFLADGKRTLEKGWIKYYAPYSNLQETLIPDLRKGDALDVKSLEKLSKKTAPPPRYSQASIIKEMEKRGLGTRATRANILQTLYDRSYISGRRIEVTELGMKVATTLKNFVPDFVDEKLTRKFEEDLEKLASGEVDERSILSKAEEALVKISEEFKENEDKIGKELGESVVETEKEKSTLGACPDCSGELRVMYSPLTKKSFVGCSSYSRCKECGFSKAACKCICPICEQKKGKCKCSWKEKIWVPSCSKIYPLPAGATIYSSNRICEKCKTPIIKVYRKGRRPFEMCLDPKCETKANWGKKKSK